jgi:hypothetical protein
METLVVQAAILVLEVLPHQVVAVDVYFLPLVAVLEPILLI